MLNENGGSRTDTLIKLVLVFFLSLLSFSVGTFVGKQFSDSQHKIAELEGDSDRSVASIPADATKAAPNPAISEDEISKVSDEFVKKERQENPGTPATATPPNEMAAASNKDLIKEPAPAAPKKDAKPPIAVHDEIANVTKQIAQGMTIEPPKPAAKTRFPSSYPKNVEASAVGKYTVQLSAFSTEEEAKTAAQNFRDKGYSAFYAPGQKDGKTWYRVSVGQFTTYQEAKDYKNALPKDNNFENKFVNKISQ